MDMDLSGVVNTEAKRFLQQFFRNRAVNRQFYEEVPEDQFDFRMVDNPKRKSDSPSESLGHQIGVQNDYINGVITGTLAFRSGDDKQIKNLSKVELLQKLKEADQKLIELLSEADIGGKKVKVPWIKTPIPALASLWALDSHEVLHTGWNLAVMDHLGIKRFPALKAMWG